MKYRITVGDKTYHVEVGDLNVSPIQVKVDGEEFAVTWEQADESVAAASSLSPPEQPFAPLASVSEPDTNQVIAPMPGTIIEVLVSPGERVDRAARLCTLEAMKMKSPIRAPRGGTIAQVHIVPGQTVAYGDILFTFKTETGK